MDCEREEEPSGKGWTEREGEGMVVSWKGNSFEGGRRPAGGMQGYREGSVESGEECGIKTHMHENAIMKHTDLYVNLKINK